MSKIIKILFIFLIINQVSFSQNKSEKSPKKISLSEVLNKYFDAIGGLEKIKKVKSRAFYQSSYSIIKTKELENTIKGKTFSVIGENQEILTIVANDNKIASKVFFDGEKGYTDIPGVIKTEFDSKMIEFYKKSICLFSQETNRSNYSNKVLEQEFSGKECYVLELNSPAYGGSSYKSKEYYSKATGLLIGASFDNKQSNSISYFKDYTLIDGILTSTQQVSYTKTPSVGSTIISSVYLEKASYNVDLNRYLKGSDNFLKQEIGFYPSDNKHKNALRDLKLIHTDGSISNDVSAVSKQSIVQAVDTLEDNLRSRIYKQLKKDKKSSSSVSAISSTINPKNQRFDVKELVESGANSALKYRRSSLYTLMINDEKRERNSVIKNAFGNSEMSEKFNDHNLGPYLIEGTGGDKDQTGFIQSYLDEKNVAKELVARWFNRDEKGNFDMKLIAERGQYNASDLNSRIAQNSKRGAALLKDAGEELIRNTFVIVYDFKYTNKEDQAKKRGGFLKLVSSAASLVGADDVALITDGVNLASDVVGKGYFVRTTSYLYRLVWDEETANKFYTEYWSSAENPDPEKIKSFEKANFFKLKYVGSEVSRSNLQSTVFTTKSDDDLIEISTTKGFDKNIGKLQRTYEEFRVKTPLYKGNPISAKIGLKEGLENGDKFEVLEQIINEEGVTSYKRIGKIKVQRGKIWDNTFLAEEAKNHIEKNPKKEKTSILSNLYGVGKKGKEKTKKTDLEYTVFSGKKGVYASGMLIRQIN